MLNADWRFATCVFQIFNTRSGWFLFACFGVSLLLFDLLIVENVECCLFERYQFCIRWCIPASRSSFEFSYLKNNLSCTRFKSYFELFVCL